MLWLLLWSREEEEVVVVVEEISLLSYLLFVLFRLIGVNNYNFY